MCLPPSCAKHLQLYRPVFPPSSTQRQGRGAFIVIEGLDRAGKSTQVARLSEALAGNGAATVLKFPDRTTPIGKLLNSYLADSSTKLDDRAVHLLFAANRWEVAERIRREVLEEGKVVIADRYAWSGVAYSRAKVRMVRLGDTLAVILC